MAFSLKHVRESLIEKAPDALKELLDDAPLSPHGKPEPIPEACTCNHLHVYLYLNQPCRRL